MLTLLAVAFLSGSLVQASLCPDGYRYFEETNRCYKLYPEDQTFSYAQDKCRLDNATLVSIHSQKENDFVGDLTFIGMRSRDDDELNFQWIDGSPVDFTAWAAEQPTYYRNLTDGCTMLNFFASDYKKAWIIIACHLVVKNGEAEIYDDAERVCMREGGHLASVHSQVESDFVSALFSRAGMGLYIGLRKNDQGVFVWTDGTPVDFTAWDVGQPALDPDENCVGIDSDFTCGSQNRQQCRQWRNIVCIYSQFVCAMAAGNASERAMATTKSSHTGVIIGVVVGVVLLLFLLLILIIGCILRRRRETARHLKELHRLSLMRKTRAASDVMDENETGKAEAFYTDIEALHRANFDTRFLIPFKRLGKVETILGTGNFGMVFKSVWRPTLGTQEAVEVACKQLHLLDDSEKKCEFLLEAVIMMSLRHPNVVGIHGVAFNAEQVPILVMELLGGGCLYDYLRENSTTEYDRLRFGQELATGMLYLHSCNLLHRDLATRNCMLTAELTLKISDFGLARKFHETYEFQHARPMPYRWTAPEAFEIRAMTAKSDVWSYGVTLWEIYSRADLPYKEIDNMHDYFKFLKWGGRLAKPKDCPEDFFDALMRKCWETEAKDRPGFDNINVVLSMRLQQSLKLAEAPAEETPSVQGLGSVQEGCDSIDLKPSSAINEAYSPQNEGLQVINVATKDVHICNLYV